MEEENEKRYAGMTRRSLCLGAGGAAVLLAMGGLAVVPAQAKVRPPGGQDEEGLLSSCIRCERCIEACPKGALRPAHVEDGILGVRTPASNFDEGWCDFCAEANGGMPRCADACPTEALKLAQGASPQTVIMGKARIIKDWCLAWSKANGCRFCAEACPYGAIELDEYNRPVVLEDKCNGCGACQCSCVSLKEGSIAAGATSRAIIVEPTAQA